MYQRIFQEAPFVQGMVHEDIYIYIYKFLYNNINTKLSRITERNHILAGERQQNGCKHKQRFNPRIILGNIILI